MSPPCLSLRGINVALGGRAILKDLSVDLPLHGMSFIVGPSGSGKSTLCRVAVGLIRPASGSIEYVPASGPSLRVERASEAALSELRRAVPYVIQASALLDWLTLRENIALAARTRHPSKAHASAEVAQALERVGLTRWADRRPPEVSPGLRKRAAIARALVLAPTAIILDEPTTGLDRVAADQVIETLLQLRAQSTGVLAVSHDARTLEAVAEHVIEVREGHITYVGALDDFEPTPGAPSHG